MPDLLGQLFELLPSPFGLIAIIATLAFVGAYVLVRADLKNAAGRDRLRTALQAGGHWRRLYIQLLTPELDRLDRFLGDADKAAFSLPSPFRNREAHPYWTGWSFDRCALIALVYPLLSLFVVWIWTGESGPIAEWLGMKHGAVWWSRFIAAVAIILMSFAVWQFMRLSGWRRFVWLAVIIALAVAVAVDAGVAASVAAFVVLALASVVGIASAGAGAGVVAVAVAFAFAVALGDVVVVAGAVAFALAGIVVVAGGGGAVAAALAVAAAAESWERRNRLGGFWVAYWPAVFVACYIGLIGVVWSDARPTILSFLLMFALVPLVNVPLDWASLGLTRALLRRGVEEDAPSPVILGLIDFFFGLILLVLLAVALIAALQMADRIIVHFGGKPVANVVALLDNIADKPRDPANYWAYATLFSPLIPSALNAVIGAVSLIGWGLPQTRERVLTYLATLDRDENDEGIRLRVSVRLASQVFAGTVMTCLVLWGLVELLLITPFVFPFVLDLLKQFALALE